MRGIGQQRFRANCLLLLLQRLSEVLNSLLHLQLFMKVFRDALVLWLMFQLLPCARGLACVLAETAGRTRRALLVGLARARLRIIWSGWASLSIRQGERQILAGGPACATWLTSCLGGETVSLIFIWGCWVDGFPFGGSRDWLRVWRLCSTSPPGGNQVDGLPPALHNTEA